ncbi:hypothetical protein KKC88_05270 [Patescibacteria group bacterium]|nr:hypothetical protein [Patescibacteria group bacterium]MBU1673601.1 hypothetical protein [Patescibacteria group bacterium]MBU1964037.1 hypothetical protein [Patescibacteria group bacterium]
MPKIKDSVSITDSFNLVFQVKFSHRSGEIFTQARVQVELPTGNFLMPPDAPMVFNLSPANGKWVLSSEPLYRDLAAVTRVWLIDQYLNGKKKEDAQSS